MPKIKYRLSLTEEERDELKSIITKGKHSSQNMLNALILLNCDEDAPQPRTLRDQDIAQVLQGQCHEGASGKAAFCGRRSRHCAQRSQGDAGVRA
ncbi:MAG: hypothetical protein GXP08_06780 [Gammaproteobacteria bacterium]|nr:hypothetical protein [Gammaproteobacteria bacterium]